MELRAWISANLHVRMLAAASAIAAICLMASAARADNPSPPAAPTAPSDAQTNATPPAGQSSDEARRMFDGARSLHTGGAFDLALDEWEKFLKAFPDDPLAPQAQFYAGVCYLSVKDKQYEKARDAFEKVIAKYPKFEQLNNAYFNLGLCDFNLAQAGKSEDYAKAADAFEQMIARFPKSSQVPEALYYRGESLYAEGKKEDAAKAWGRLVADYPQNPVRPRALYNLGLTQAELNQQDAAGATFDTFLKEFPQQELASEVYVRKADTLLASNHFADAEQMFAGISGNKEYPLADYATLRYGAALAAQKKYAKAAAAYASLPEKFPKSQFVAPATLAAGNCYYLAGKYGEAREWLGKVLAGGGPDAADAAHWIARSWLKENHPAEALATVEKALPTANRSPRHVDLLMDQADALYDLPGRRGESAPLYARIAKDFPGDPQAAAALYASASAALAGGDYSAALEHAKNFERAFPKSDLMPDARFVAAESRLLLGKYAEADKAYASLLKDFPTHADAQQWLVRRGFALYLEKHYTDVVALLKAALDDIKSRERKSEALFLVGSSQLELKQYADARQSLEKSLAAAPHGPQADEALLALAVARSATKDASAAADLKRLIADFPQSKLLDRAHFRLGELLMESGDNAAAAAEYQWVVDHAADSPLVPGALVGLGWSELNRSDAAAAEKSFGEVIEKHAGDALAARARYGRAAARQQLKNYAGAAEDIEAFLKSDPKGPARSDALYVLGLAQEGLKKNAEAAATFDSLLSGDPHYPAADKVLYELAWSRKSAGDEQQAADAFARLANDHADSPLAAESWFNVGEFDYHNKKDYKAAAAAYSAALAKAAPGELGEKIAHKLGWAYFQSQDYAKAADAFAAELKAYPQGPLSADAAIMAGESLFKQEKYAAALETLQKALGTSGARATTSPANPASSSPPAATPSGPQPSGPQPSGPQPSSPEFVELALLHAGQAAGQVKKWDLSLALLNRLLDEFPNSSHRMEATYEKGFAEQNLGHDAEAMKLYEAVADHTDSVVGARARFMMGEVAFDQGNHKEAIRNYYKVIYGYGDVQSPPPFHVWQANAEFEAARCFEVIKSVAQAKKLYNELLSRYPDSDKAAAAKARLAAIAG